MAKVFIFNGFESEGMETPLLKESVLRYWDGEPEILFIAHFYELARLTKNGGYAGVRVIDIEDSKEVRVQWLPFSKQEENEYRNKDTNDYFFFFSDSIIEHMFASVPEGDSKKKILIVKLLKANDGELGCFCLGGTVGDPGAGGTSPTAGTKLP